MEIVKQTIQYARAAMKFNTQALAEGELTPPASLPPIGQVLAVDGRASASAEAMEEKMLIDGTVTLSVIYLCSEGNVHGFESIAMFKHVADCQGVSPDAKCGITPTVGEIKHRMSNGSLHVRSQINLECHASENAEIEAVSNIQGAQTKQVPFKANELLREVEEISLREDIRLPRSAEKLLGIGGYALVQGIVMEGSKAVVEGTLRVNLMFVTPDGTIMQTPASMPFSERIALPDSAGNLSAQLRILSLSAVLVDEAIATADAQVEITLSAETQQEYQLISDAYATDKMLECVRQRIPICDNRHMSSRCTLRQSLKIPANLPAADRVLLALLRPSIESATPREGTLELKGTLRVSVIYLDREGKLYGFSEELPFECEGEAAGIKPNMDVSVGVCCELVHAGASGMEIPLQSTLDVSIEGIVCQELFLVTDLIENEREASQKGLLVYFPEENEDLWGIGKRFGIKIDELRELNQDIDDNPKSVILNLR